MLIEDSVIYDTFTKLENGRSVVLPKSNGLYEGILNYAEHNYKNCQVDVRCSGREIRMVPEGKFIRK